MILFVHRLCFWIHARSILQSNGWFTTICQKIWLEQLHSSIIYLAIRNFNMLNWWIQLNDSFSWLKSDASAVWSFLKNNLQKVANGKFCQCLVYITISTPVLLILILMVWKKCLLFQLEFLWTTKLLVETL